MPNKGIEKLNTEKKAGEIIIKGAVSAALVGVGVVVKKINKSKKIDNDLENVRDKITDYNSKSGLYKATHKNELKALQEERDKIKVKK